MHCGCTCVNSGMGRCTRMILDDVFEQKDEIAKAVSEELEKVGALTLHCVFSESDGREYCHSRQLSEFSWLSSV